MIFKEYCIADLCKVCSSKRIFMSEYVSSGIPFFRGKEVSEKSISKENVSTELFISNEKYKEIKTKFGAPQTGDILITAVGTIGNVWLVDIENFYFKDGNILWLKDIDTNIINRQYLYYFLKSKQFENQVEATLIGSSQKALLIDELKKIKIEVPDLKTQQKIVHILSALDQKIGLNIKENGTLENIIKCHYKSFISNKDQKRTEYKTSDLFDYNGGYSYTSAELVDESTIGMMTIKNFERTGGFKIDGFKPLAPQKTKIPTADLFDIFVACTDVTQNADIIGNAIMLLDKGEYEDTTYSMDLVKIEPRINKFALYAILSSKDFKNFALGYKSGTTVLHLSKKCLKEYVISLPEEKEVEAFGEIVEKLCKKISNNLAENRNLCQIRSVLLPKLLSGEIDVNRIEV